MSFRCFRGRRPRLPGNALPPAALPVAALPRLTRQLGRRSFLSAASSASALAAWRGQRGSCPVASLPFQAAVATLLAIRPTLRSRRPAA